MKFRKINSISYFIGLVALLPTLLVLPANFFDNGRSMCLSVLLFDKTCPACGSTRGVQHLLHFDVVTATEYNKLSVILLPILLLVYGFEIYRMIKYFRKQAKNKKIA